MLNPIVAAVAMVGSSLFVLTNSLSLAGFDFTSAEQTNRDTRLSSDGTRVDSDSKAEADLGQSSEKLTDGFASDLVELI